MRKIKLNKKIILASVIGIMGVALVAIALVACSQNKTKSDSRNLTLNNFYGRPSSDGDDAYQAIYASKIQDGARMLGLISFRHKNPISKYFNSPKDNQQVSAVLIDEIYDLQTGKDRIASITYRADQAAFLAGIAAAYYLNSNQNVFGKDNKLTWGGFVGIHLPSTTRFIQGFKFGIQWANEKLKNKKVKQTENNEEKEWINVEQVFATNYQSGDFSPTSDKAKAIVNQLVSNNVDLILPVAGPQIDYATTAAAESSKPIVVVGVDTEQELDDNTNKARISENNKSLANGKTIIFSIVKRLDLAFKGALLKASEGAQLTNDINKDAYKLGTHTEASFNKNTYVDNTALVELSKAGHQYLIDAIKLSGLKEVNDYKTIVEIIQEDPLFKLLSQIGTKKLDEVATKSQQGDWVLKSEYQDLPFIQLQKMLGGLVYVDQKNELYPYELSNSFYLEKDPNKRQASRAFYNYWNAKDANQINLVKIFLGQSVDVLKDKSFSESIYKGLEEFYKSKNIIIPKLY
ncbi:BMP family ABC transporter substrate-binding protein [Ureaplasma parvum]|uniref:BMP family ABC transporter substrate-binding protein n=1 Tax=Ureaplasma parvum TaxID=134821 RepID=UPI001F184355|nr:BMP family ABC transporter substrate-binding protein [Ureaplasma parvum]UIU28749.1 BMP family ABC transporter substrate-binding protein [Ureaplasma parvum]